MIEQKKIEQEYKLQIKNPSILGKIQGRKSIFLETNVWIDSADEKTKESKRVKELLRESVKSGKIFCPSSEIIIWELYKQEYDSMLRVGELMEELSLNLSFARKEELFRSEVKRFILNFLENKQEPLNELEIFVPVAAYLSSSSKIVFPEGWSQEDQKKLGDFVYSSLISLTVTGLLKMRKDNRSFINKERDPGYSDSWKKRWEITKGNKRKMHRIEVEKIATSFLIPLLNNLRSQLPIEQQLKFLSYVKSLPKDKYGGAVTTILARMPALKNEIDILTVSGYDPNRKGNMNDFFDIELMAIPFAYADIFVTFDGWIKHLLTSKNTFIKPDKCKCIFNLADLEVYLNNLD